MVERSAKTCVAVNAAVALLRDKWTILCLGALSKADGPLRYNALEHAVGGISQRMLTLTLKTLEENGLVRRTVFPTVPPRVDYELTPVGPHAAEAAEGAPRLVAREPRGDGRGPPRLLAAGAIGVAELRSRGRSASVATTSHAARRSPPRRGVCLL
jgi:DNA-binding HxlR family transcriptional regulator